MYDFDITLCTPGSCCPWVERGTERVWDLGHGPPFRVMQYLALFCFTYLRLYQDAIQYCVNILLHFISNFVVRINQTPSTPRSAQSGLAQCWRVVTSRDGGRRRGYKYAQVSLFEDFSLGLRPQRTFHQLSDIKHYSLLSTY